MYVNVAFFLLANSSASYFYVPTFRNTLFHLMEQSVSKRRHMKFRRRGITQKIQYSKQGKVGNREYVNVILHLKFKNSPNVLTVCVSGRTFPVCSP